MILSTSVIMVARSQSGAMPAPMAWGANPCQLPCWSGITPGATHPAQVPALVATLPDFSGLSAGIGRHYQVYQGGSQPTASLVYNANTMTALALYEAVPLAWLVASLGVPDCARLRYQVPARVGQRLAGLDWQWLRRDNLIEATIPGEPTAALAEPMTTSSQGLRVTLLRGGSDACPAGSVTWRGAAPLWVYEAAGG